MKKFLLTLGLCLVMANAQKKPKTDWKTPMVSWNDGEQPPISIEDQAHIISGTVAATGSFPWQVAIFISIPSGTAFCGGILIHPSWVLTAAHCTVSGSSFSLRFGSTNPRSGGVVMTTKTAYTHAQFNPSYLTNDVGLIKLASPVTLSSTIKVIPLYSAKVSANTILRVSGWGATSDLYKQISSVLLYTDVSAVTNAYCAGIFGSQIVTDKTICTRGYPKNAPCSGDSGGPLTVTSGTTTYLVGVVSFGSSKGCEAAYPSGYSRVEPFKPWIKTITGLSL